MLPQPVLRTGFSKAARGKSSTGWYDGFKLHLAINGRGELLGFYLTAAKVDERVTADWITQELSGKLIGDKGYVSSSLFETLMTRALRLITILRRNMKNRLLAIEDKKLLRKRALFETVNDQLKNISNIEPLFIWAKFIVQSGARIVGTGDDARLHSFL